RSVDRMDNGNYQVVTKGLAIRSSLINQGFDTRAVSLDSVSAIPDDIAALVIADPLALYAEAELALIRSYLDAGGNLLLAGEPSRAATFNELASVLGVGVEMHEGTVMQESAYHDADLVYARFAPEASSIGLG